MSLYHKYNSENVLVRAVLAGLLDVLNNNLKYDQTWGDEVEEIISVPWFYNQSGDERFMQDFYTHYATCVPPRPVDGNMDMIPRGVITYTGSGIDEGRITSRFIQGRYVKENNGMLEQYVSFLYSIPLSIRIDCEMWADNQLTALKIEQEIREVFFKNVTYYVYYKGMRVGCTAGFPADVTVEKNIQYSFEADNKPKLNFQIEIESYQPVFDPTTEQLASSRMKGIALRVYEADEKSDGYIQVTNPSSPLTVPKGIPFWIEWIYNGEGGIINKIDAYWVYTGENDRTEIELNVPNHEYYVWNIPETFTSFKEPDIIWEETDNISVIRKPVVKVVPDLLTKQITSSSFQVIENGYFRTDLEDASINIQLEMKDDDNNVSYSTWGTIWMNVKFNGIDETDPTVVIDPSLVFPGTVDYKHINIHIANTVDTDVFGIAYDIKII